MGHHIARKFENVIMLHLVIETQYKAVDK